MRPNSLFNVEEIHDAMYTAWASNENTRLLLINDWHRFLRDVFTRLSTIQAEKIEATVSARQIPLPWQRQE